MRRFFTKKLIIETIVWLVIGIAVFGIVSAMKSGNPAEDLVIERVQKHDLVQTVLATGQAVSETDLNLSFKVSGVVKSLNARVGEVVSAGEILASLDQGDAVANLTSARGSLVAANANYQKIFEGASSEEITLAQRAVETAQVTLDNAQKNLDETTAQQEVLVRNSYSALLNGDLSARVGTIYDNSLTLTVSGTYQGDVEGQYRITLLPTGNGNNYYYQITGLENYIGLVDRGLEQSMGEKGLYITFGTSGILSSINVWTIDIPNKNSSSYVTNHNAYQSALKTQVAVSASAQATIATAKANLAQQQAQLDLKRAQARPADLEAARAQVLSAQGQVQSAQAVLENTIIRAPITGTITRVDIKIGELAPALSQVIVLQDVTNLHLEANISEANVALVAIGQSIEVTFDAFGPDVKYKANVRFVEPASTVISGVVNYKVIAGMEEKTEIKPGMTANMIISTAERQNVIAVSQRAIITSGNKKIVRIITDPVQKTYEDREVQTGLLADGGLIEILSGLEEGEEIVTFIKAQ